MLSALVALGLLMASPGVHADALPSGSTGHPLPHILDAPPGVDRWEPGGAAVIPGERRLWVVNDKAPVLAAYDLPLAPGRNAPVAHVRITRPIDRVKLEAIRFHPKHGLLLLDAFGRRVLAGVTFAPDGEPRFDFDLKHLSAPAAAFDALPPVEVEYLSVEALVVIGERVWSGVRGYQPAGRNDALTPLSAYAADDGTVRRRAVRRHEGHTYGLSDALCSPSLPDRCYETWSAERETGDTPADVSGLLTVSPLVDGLPGEPRVCRVFPGKAEGVARFRDTLIVVFDNDARRKRPGDPMRFPLEVTQDYADTVPISDCAPTP